ncbi:MAG: PDZ domain-containing protein, partial [Planctomycetota bacterium]
VTSNPGAAGGAVVDREGRLIGMLGRELTSRVTGTWLNYAAPVASLRIPVERIMQGYSSAGSSTTDDLVPTIDLLMQFGFALTPDIVQRTPPYVDYVRDDSPASAAGLLPDDLIITANGLVTSSTAELRRNVARIAGGNLTLLVKRGDEFLEFELAPAEPTEDE